MNEEPQLDFLLKQMADGNQPELPNPGLVWWRAQILKKQEQKERIERPIVVMRLVAAVGCLAAFLGLLAGNRQLQTVMIHDGLLLPLAVVGVAVSLASVVLFFWSPSKT
jgi:hypothetical protein